MVEKCRDDLTLGVVGRLCHTGPRRRLRLCCSTLGKGKRNNKVTNGDHAKLQWQL